MHTPRSTYRLQIRAGLTLHDAARLVPYLHDLGVDTVYVSPLLQATSGSDHGYDVVDPTRIDPERGGEDGWARFVAATREAGLGVLVDIVPNHLGVTAPAENPSWWSVLAEGESSPYAGWYDIDWSRPLTLPVLGDDEDAVRLAAVDGGWELQYHEHRFPVAADTCTDGDDVATVRERQHYRLINWRRANTELSYRRFFAVNGLAGLRVEDPEVFDATHARVLRWLAEDRIVGLRIDHPDGLVDPGGYLARLRSHAPDSWLVVEKILEPGEQLPADWPVGGTTGYDAMTELTQVLVDPTAADAFTTTYGELTGDTRSVAEHVVAAKDFVCRTLFGTEFTRLAGLLPEATAAYGSERVIDALRAVAVAFGVYRSYLPDGVEDLDAALALAVERHPELAPVIDAVSGRLHDHLDEAARRFQQLTGPAMAKGLEDTAWYRHSRFVALNEVGGDPATFGLALADFHDRWRDRAEALPDSMTALSTHDTKRGEDVRARLAACSEIPRAWHHYAENFGDEAGEIDGLTDRAFTYLLAQTFAGVGFIDRDRMHAYAEKAMREAATATAWDEPDQQYESAVHQLVDKVYDDPSLRGIVAKLITIVEQAGWSNGLTQKVVQLTGPGVPDVYQGTEVWQDSLVDPDNRRPIDFDRLAELARTTATVPPVDGTGAAKLWVTRHALRLRRDRPELFTGYTPLAADGPAADHCLAFDRGGAVTVATRLPLTLHSREHGWADTTLPLTGSWLDVLTDTRYVGPTRVSDLLSHLPVALLVRA
ncbi:malto-oligosyltrehalose synthase [Propionibacteriaceae bacterium Y2011]